MSVDMSSLSPEDYVVVDSPVPLRGPYDAAVGSFGPVITPLDKSKKMYLKANISEDIVYLKPATMEEPRVLITANTNVELATTSYSYQTDPNRTVVSNIAIEDLLIYLKVNTPPYDNNFIRFMAHYMSPIIGNTTLLVGGYTTSNSVQHAVLAPKAAHPYFAGIPVKSNQFTYGPWTNYPELIKSNIFPGVNSDSASKAVENMIGGVKVEINTDYVPWNYGSMSLLDAVVLGEIQANSTYQQVIETARIDTIGLPVLGLGSPFIYPGSSAPPNGTVLVNNQIFTPKLVPLPYVQKRYQANANPLENIPIVGELTVAPNIPARTEVTTNLNYNILVLDAQYYNSLAPIVSNIQCSISPQQVRTTYNFRTHTRKLGLFNKENADRIRKFAISNIKRNRELASQTNKLTNKINKETQARLHSIKETGNSYSSKSLSTGLFGTSPTEIMCGRAFPFVTMSGAVRKSAEKLREEMKKNKKKSGSNDTEGGGTVVPYTLVMPYGLDPGDDNSERIKYASTNQDIKEFKDAENPSRTSIRNSRWSTYVGVYQSKEAPADLLPEYSLKSAMSLDGIFSPVSFYPTKFYSTYALQKYPRGKCPYCSGTGTVKDQAYTNTDTINMVDYQCPYCASKRDGLSTTATTTASAQSLEILPPYIVTNKKDINVISELGSSSSVSSASSTSSSSGSSSGQDIAINLVSLQPIVVPYGEFRNYNAGSDDKCRHSIEVVAHGETPPQKGWGINTRWNMGRFIKSDGNMQNNNTENGSGWNADYFHRDLLTEDKTKLNNQRFFGLRGPIVYHGWGYDLEGYPVPNAADEPLRVDAYGRPQRFTLKQTVETATVKFKELKNKEMFVLEEYSSDWWKKGEYYYKVPNMSITIGDNIVKIDDDREVHKVKLENDMTIDPGTGNFTGNNLGDIISKTQKYEGGKWTEKKKLKEFYRNWAEHPNLWKVGPIDLRWDENRQVWTTKSSDAMTIYKMVYVTLEEDLTKSKDYDETYPARGFLDDIEYSVEKLPADSRRLVFVKDKGGYTAPRGAKLLCRYDKDSGFYEPVSKQTFVVGGTIGYGKSATIEMSYIQGRKKGETIPTSSVTFEDPFEFRAQSGKKGLFTFINGSWTLTAAKSN
jgi:DNA-directed RNA polymerase subunit RPC12/RpoP